MIDPMSGNQYDPQMQMLSTNMMLNLRSGHPVYDTILSVVLMTVVVYVMQCKTVLLSKFKQVFKRCFKHRYRVRYEGKIQSNRFSNESFSESFVALKDWVITGIRNQEYDNAHTLCEIQLPRGMSLMMDSMEVQTDDDDELREHRHRRLFNRSTMILEQIETIRHKTYDIYVHHESYKCGGGSSSSDDDDGGMVTYRNGSGATKSEYTVHVITLSSNGLTTNQLVDFVEEKVLLPFQERRRQREKNKLFYYLFDRHDTDEDSPQYEKYEWTSTKTFDHVKSEHTAMVKRRIDHFLTNRSWYETHGKPYSLTILLYGPPGCGKTSMVKAIANYCRRHIKEVPLPRVKSRQSLMEVFHGKSIGFNCVRPQDCIYVFEEFDKMGDVVTGDANDSCAEETTDTTTSASSANAVTSDELDRALHKAIQGVAHSSSFGSSSTSKGQQNGGYGPPQSNPKTPPLSLGDILNVMDGLLENNGIITIFTANKIDHLHQALIRPGRIDMKVRMDKATTKSVKEIIQMVHGGQDGTTQKTLDAIPDDDVRFHKRWSPAEVEEACFQEASGEGVLASLERQMSS